ncbi:MAG: hypothetical protein AB1486_18540 [Planctomycetota bacterium]
MSDLLAAGLHRIILVWPDASSLPRLLGEWFVAPGESLDVGILHVPGMSRGTLRAEIDPSEWLREDNCELELYPCPDNGWLYGAAWDRHVFVRGEPQPLPPGDYVLHVRERCAGLDEWPRERFHHFEIRPGEETSLVMRRELHPRSLLCFRRGDGQTLDERVVFTVRDAAGCLRAFAFDMEGPITAQGFWALDLPAGGYEIAAATDSGLAAHETVTLPGGDPAGDPIIVELR